MELVLLLTPECSSQREGKRQQSLLSKIHSSEFKVYYRVNSHSVDTAFIPLFQPTTTLWHVSMIL